jgi:hypothetical protein
VAVGVEGGAERGLEEAVEGGVAGGVMDPAGVWPVVGVANGIKWTSRWNVRFKPIENAALPSPATKWPLSNRVAAQIRSSFGDSTEIKRRRMVDELSDRYLDHEKVIEEIVINQTSYVGTFTSPISRHETFELYPTDDDAVVECKITKSVNPVINGIDSKTRLAFAEIISDDSHIQIVVPLTHSLADFEYPRKHSVSARHSQHSIFLSLQKTQSRCRYRKSSLQ